MKPTIKKENKKVDTSKQDKLKKIKKLVEMIEKQSGKKVEFIQPKKKLSEKQIKIKKLIEMIQKESGKKVVFQEKKQMIKEGEDFVIKCDVGGKERYFIGFDNGKPQFTLDKSHATVFEKSGFYDLVKGAIPMYEPVAEPTKQQMAMQEAKKKKSEKKKDKKYPWDKCEEDVEKEYGSKKQADKVCGAIKAKK